MLNFLKPQLRIQRPNPIPLISFLIIQIFWMSLYSSGAFRIIGEIKGQIVILIIWVFTLLFFRKKSLNVALSRIEKHKQELILLVAFVFVNVFNMVLGRGDMVYGYFVRSLLLVITYATVIIHFKNDYQRYLQAVIIVTMVLGLIAVYVLPILYATPLIGRFIGEFYKSHKDAVPWFGSWGFFMTYAISMPCLIAVAHQQRGLLKLFLYLLCFSMVLLILYSSFTASIILLLMGFAGFLLFSIRKAKSYLILALTVLMFVVIIRQSDVRQIRELENIGNKIIAIFTLTSDANLGYEHYSHPRNRFYLMKVSMNIFSDNPFFGVGFYRPKPDDVAAETVGNHSGIIDSLAQFGLLGIIWYLIFIAICFRRVFLALKGDSHNLINQARFLTFFLFLIGAMANPMFFDVGTSALVYILSVSPIGLNAASRKPYVTPQNDCDIMNDRKNL